MGIFESLKSSFSTGNLKKEQVERLRESIWNALADGQISDQELQYINSFYRESQLSQEDFDKLRNEIFMQIVQQAISDRRVDQRELNSLNHIINRLSISPEIESWAQRQVQYYLLFDMIESGAPLPIGTASGLLMQKGEVCHVSLPAYLLRNESYHVITKVVRMASTFAWSKGYLFDSDNKKDKWSRSQESSRLAKDIS